MQAIVVSFAFLFSACAAPDEEDEAPTVVDASLTGVEVAVIAGGTICNALCIGVALVATAVVAGYAAYTTYSAVKGRDIMLSDSTLPADMELRRQAAIAADANKAADDAHGPLNWNNADKWFQTQIAAMNKNKKDQICACRRNLNVDLLPHFGSTCRSACMNKVAPMCYGCDDAKTWQNGKKWWQI